MLPKVSEGDAMFGVKQGKSMSCVPQSTGRFLKVSRMQMVC
jgi:hypothetical protein